MGWPNTPEGREKKRADQRRWWHKKFGGVERPVRVRSDQQEHNEITEDDILMQIETSHEQYLATQETPVLKSELEELFDRIIVLRKQITQLTEKRDALRVHDFTGTTGEFGKPLDDVELADAQQQENARVTRLRQKYDAAILEKEKERDAVGVQAEALKQRKRYIEHLIKGMKNGTMDAHLAKLADDRAASERELAMHNAVLNDSPTYAQRVAARKGKRSAEMQIRKQIQREADMRRVIPEYEAMVSYIAGDFEGQRKIQQQLEKQRVQLEKQLENTPTGEEPLEPEEQPTYVEFLEPWGGYREGMYQMVATLSEEVSADLVDANIAQYVAVQHHDDAADTAARQDGTGNYPML